MPEMELSQNATISLHTYWNPLNDALGALKPENNLEEEELKDPIPLQTQVPESTFPSQVPNTRGKMEGMEFLQDAKMFPTKLWRLVNNHKINGIIWNDNGDGIIVNKNILEKEFSTLSTFRTTILNFTRQLNAYGFMKGKSINRGNPKINQYFHPNFQRNQPELLALMRRCVKTPRPIKEHEKSYPTERWRERRNLDETDDDPRNTNLHNDNLLLQEIPMDNCVINLGHSYQMETPVDIHEIPEPKSTEGLKLLIEMSNQTFTPSVTDHQRSDLTERCEGHHNVHKTDDPRITNWDNDQNMQSIGFSQIANNFPKKLWQLVNDPEIGAITWNDQGDGIIMKKNLIEENFLTLNGFRASHAMSFIRQLNIYGFKKSQSFRRNDPNIHHYFHPNFIRNQPDLLHLVRRSVRKPRASVKEDQKSDVSERWRAHRNLDDTADDPQNTNMNNDTFIQPEIPKEACFFNIDHYYQMETPLEIHKIAEPNSTEALNFPIGVTNNQTFTASMTDHDPRNTNLDNKNNLEDQIKEPIRLEVQQSISTTPAEVPNNNLGSSSPFEANMPQSSLPQSDTLMQQEIPMEACFINMDHYYQLQTQMEIGQIQDENYTEGVELNQSPLNFSMITPEQIQEELPPPPPKPLHDLEIGDWIMIKGLGNRRKKQFRWLGPHQVLQTSYNGVMIAEGATWLDTSQFKRISEILEKPVFGEAS